MPRILVFITVLLALAACSGTPKRAPPDDVFTDALFEPRPQLVDADAMFVVNEPMREYLRTVVARRARHLGPREALADALRSDLRIEYDTKVTRTAAQAFGERAGNCLSLAMLAGALAAELDLPVTYQIVTGYDSWTREGGVVFYNEHVNLVLGSRPAGRDELHLLDRNMTIDFVDVGRMARSRVRPISRATVIAAFRNNRAAESLVAGDERAAYWWTRAAVEADPFFLNAWNTLGVIYMRHGALPKAERALRYAYEREPGNAQVLANLVKLTARLGRTEESEHYARMLAEVEKYPPFYFLDRGLEAIADGNADRAMTLLRKALTQMPNDHEVHFAIALADLQRGDIKRARRHLARAVEASPTRERRAIYAAKLDRLNAAAMN